MKPKRSDGFTLIEVLIAFATLALVLSAVFRSFSTGLSSERKASQAVARVLEARSVLEAVGVSEPLKPGDFEGELSTGESWIVNVERVAPIESLDGRTDLIEAYRVSISVRDRHGEALSLSTMKLRPSEE